MKKEQLKIEFFVLNNPNTKVTGCLFVCVYVCLYRRISLTAKTIGFSLGPGCVYNILVEGNTTLPREIAPRKKIIPLPPKII